ncbi:MAG: ATP-binding protein [Desulfobulbaceae bacterium]|nr:ATP-binding protein [Desulfobulbaceae bacterium]
MKNNVLPLTLLLVDDDAAVQNLIRVKMVKRGYHVLAASDGVTAFRLLREHHVDIVLLDHDMPERNGIEVFFDIKESWPGLPVVMVTSHGSKHLIKEFLLAGGRDFIEKPIVDFEAFEFRIKRVVRDVVREREAAQKLNEVIAREESQKATNSLLTSMSHEIRTPLNSVEAMAYMLKQSGLTNKQDEYVTNISKAVNSLLSLVNNILNFSAVERGTLVLDSKDFNLEELLRDICAKFSEDVEQKGLSFCVRLAPQVPLCLVGDARGLEQVLSLLIDNGIKFTEQGGLEIVVTLVKTENERVVTAFAIRDTGIGMTEEECQKIFQPFTQVDATNTRGFGGVGIGLALCGKIVSLMQGEISVRSEPGRGSVFFFTAVFERDPVKRESDMVPRAMDIVIGLPADGKGDKASGADAVWKVVSEKGYGDKETSILLFRELATMLKMHDTRASRVVETLVSLAHPFPVEKEIGRLSKEIAKYNFDASLKLLMAMAEKEGIPLLNP